MTKKKKKISKIFFLFFCSLLCFSFFFIFSPENYSLRTKTSASKISALEHIYRRLSFTKKSWQRMDEQMDGWMDGQMDGQTDGWTDRWMYGCTDG